MSRGAQRNRLRRIRTRGEVEGAPGNEVGVDEPVDRDQRVEQQNLDQRFRQSAALTRLRRATPPHHERPHQDEADDDAGKPSVVTGKRSSGHRNAAGFQGAPRLHLGRSRGRIGIRRNRRAQEFVQINQRPEKEGQEDRLVHGRGLQVKQVGIQRIDGSGKVGGDLSGANVDQAKHGQRAQDIGDHARNGAGNSAAPQGIVPHERQHGDVLQRQPHRSQLPIRLDWVAIVDDATRDVDVGHGIAVKQQLLVRVVIEECGNRKGAEQQGEARFVALLLVALFERVAVSGYWLSGARKRLVVHPPIRSTCPGWMSRSAIKAAGMRGSISSI